MVNPYQFHENGDLMPFANFQYGDQVNITGLGICILVDGKPSFWVRLKLAWKVLRGLE
jgi:hypothetical protein